MNVGKNRQIGGAVREAKALEEPSCEAPWPHKPSCKEYSTRPRLLMWSGVYYSYPRYCSSQVFFGGELKDAFASRTAPPIW